MDKLLIYFATCFSRQSIIRGLDLFNDGAVTKVKKNGYSYSFDVEGITDNYKTTISFNKNKQVQSCSCTCLHFASGNYCKHLYASLLKLNDIFEGKDETLLLDYESTNTLKKKNNEPQEEKDDNEIDLKKTKITKKDLDTYKMFCKKYDVDSDEMNNLLDKFDLDSRDLAKLFLMLRNKKSTEIFLEHYENKLDSVFFKEINLTLFPASTSFRELTSYLLKHSNMLQYLNYDSLKELFSHLKTPQLQNRVTLFFLCLNFNPKIAIKAFFEDSENVLNFFQSNSFLNYMKENMTKEEILDALNIKIKSKTLTRMETAFIYPYFDNKTIEEYDYFFNHNFAAPMKNHSYYNYYDYENEYYYGYPLNRTFYSILKNKPTTNLTQYDLKILYYLRNQLFENDVNFVFSKRFKQLAQGLFRTKNPDFVKIYCCLSIILEYGDNNKIIKDLEDKAIMYFSELYISQSVYCAELYELFYKLNLKNNSNNQIVILNYNKEA